MKIGVPRELKNNEFRVALTPAGVRELAGHGHHVVVETGAGLGSGLDDHDYRVAGARMCGSADEVWAEADLVLKVKEPVAEEFGRLRKGQALFAYLHLAASAECTLALLDAGTTAIAYETVQRSDGSLPLLAPMSEVAGRLATLVGANVLLRTAGGRGVLLGAVPGTRAAAVVVIGAGVAGRNATAMAVGLQAEVTLLDTNLDRLRAADDIYRGRVHTLVSNTYELERVCRSADLVIGAVLVPGAKAPTLVSNDLVAEMPSGSVLVDVAIDQGGCFEDSRPTTHDDPTYRIHNSVFYCVANIPGVVPNTSTHALTNATLPYVLRIADQGHEQALRADPALLRGLHTHNGALTHAPTALAHGLPASDPADVLAS